MVHEARALEVFCVGQPVQSVFHQLGQLVGSTRRHEIVVVVDDEKQWRRPPIMLVAIAPARQVCRVDTERRHQLAGAAFLALHFVLLPASRPFGTGGGAT